MGADRAGTSCCITKRRLVAGLFDRVFVLGGLECAVLEGVLYGSAPEEYYSLYEKKAARAIESARDPSAFVGGPASPAVDCGAYREKCMDFVRMKRRRCISSAWHFYAVVRTIPTCCLHRRRQLRIISDANGFRLNENVLGISGRRPLSDSDNTQAGARGIRSSSLSTCWSGGPD